LADRFDRRRVMVAADAIRGVAIAAIGVLSVAGALRLWHLLILVAVYGVGDALFGPAFGSIVPDVVPRDLLVEANSLNQLSRPLTFRLIGPAVGGLVIAGLGVGTAFLLDAATFAVSAGAVVLMRPRTPERGGDRSIRAALAEVGEGFRFVRSQPWLWATLLGAAISLMAFYGPFQVLVPFVVRNELGAGADGLGLVFASEGVGAVLASLVVGQRGLPRRHVTVMYVTWAAGAAVIAGYAFVTRVWEGMVYGFVHGVLFAIGAIVWMTLMHRLVPGRMLGRVTSFDWLISIGLLPASFGLAGPLAETFGTDAVLIGAGVVSSVGILAFLFVPGVRDPERAPAAATPAGTGTP
ncbi:MAG: MFS transporter, partial [Actinomycetota bacterium]|nr:MFS transporter [Actinomycetota bacterium]